MTRDVWFRILQVMVVAPWLYHVSNKSSSTYFKVGLKLVAGSIIMLNIKPLMEDYKNAQLILAQLKSEIETVTATAPVIIEGELETKT